MLNGSNAAGAGALVTTFGSHHSEPLAFVSPSSQPVEKRCSRAFENESQRFVAFSGLSGLICESLETVNSASNEWDGDTPTNIAVTSPPVLTIMGCRESTKEPHALAAERAIPIVAVPGSHANRQIG